LKQLGMPVDASYGLRDQVKEELEFAQKIFKDHPAWPVIDVTGRAIDCGHFLPEEAPQETLIEIERFLAQSTV